MSTRRFGSSSIRTSTRRNRFNTGSIGTIDNPAISAFQLQEQGVTASGNYYIDLPVLGSTLVYCDMTTDGGGWMMLGYFGSTNGVGNDVQPIFSDFGNIHTNRTYGAESFSQFGKARQIIGATSSNTQMMWRRTNDTNVIMIHSSNELFNRWGQGAGQNAYNNPGSSGRPSNLNLNGSGSGFPISTFKLSNTGVNGIVTKTNARYESGPEYCGIAWNSSYADNGDNTGSFTTFLNRRSLAYWETYGCATGGYSGNGEGAWFHADVLQMGPSRGPFFSKDKKDVEIYVKFTSKHY